MKLCPALIETTNKEKEVMFTIFDREFKREKNLEIMKKEQTKAEEKKLADKAKGGQSKEEKLKEKETKMSAKISELEEDFFKKVATDNEDINTIKARGELK